MLRHVKALCQTRCFLMKWECRINLVATFADGLYTVIAKYKDYENRT